MITNAVDDGRRVSDAASQWQSNEIARSIASATLGVFVMVSLAIPAALANKVIFVILIVLILIAPLASAGRVKIRSLSPIIIPTIFLYGYALSFVGETDRQLTNQFILSMAVLLLVYLIDWYAIDLERIIKASGVFLCLFTAASIYAVVVVPESALGTYFMDYFLEYSLGSFGERAFSDNPMFLFRIGPAPFLFLPYCLFFASFIKMRRVRDLIALILISAVIGVTTSRALIIGCLVAPSYLLVVRLRPSRQVITLCIGAAVGVFLAGYLLTQTGIFSLSEQSNSVKVGHIISFIEHMTPARMLFGEGLAAYYFSTGYNATTAHTEITLLDMVRYVGLPLTALLYVALLFPSLRRGCYGGENRTPVFLFVLYLAISLTNPVLFNSYGLLIAIWYWSRILSVHPHEMPATSRLSVRAT